MQQFQKSGSVWKAAGLVMALTLPASGVHAQAYADLQEDISNFGELLGSLRSCEQFGYATDRDQAELLVERRVRQEISDGAPGDIVTRIASEILRQKLIDLRFIGQNLRTSADYGTWVAGWADRCQRLSADFPSIVITDGDEPEVTARFVDEIRQRIEP